MNKIGKSGKNINSGINYCFIMPIYIRFVLIQTQLCAMA
jgi:hypothetical protein